MFVKELVRFVENGMKDANTNGFLEEDVALGSGLGSGLGSALWVSAAERSGGSSRSGIDFALALDDAPLEANVTFFLAFRKTGDGDEGRTAVVAATTTPSSRGGVFARK